MLTIKSLNQFYGGSHTLWDVDLSVSAGSRMCLMGRNGMGKTTLLKCIMGLLPAASGSISFDGIDLLRSPVEERARIGIGYVPQGREIFFTSDGGGEPECGPGCAQERRSGDPAACL